jgi:hypothetical protein
VPFVEQADRRTSERRNLCKTGVSIRKAATGAGSAWG